MENFLVVVDMQNDFIDGTLGTCEAQSIVENAAKIIKDFDGKIIVTLDTHHENYLETNEGRHLPVTHCVENTQGWELNPLISDALSGKNFHTIKKGRFGSLKIPDYIEKVCDDNNPNITLIGLCTDICVVSNALILKVAYPEANITVIENCCAGVTPKKHAAAIETMKSCQITIL